MANKEESESDCPEIYYFMNESVSDVVFIVDGQRIPALKTVLSLKSEVFRVMFSHNFKESKEEEVVIKDTNYEAFKTFIPFLICEQLVFKDDKDLQHIEDVCGLSEKYNTSRLKAKIVKHMVKIGVDFDNIEWFARFAFRYQIQDLMSKVMAIIHKNITKIVEKDSKQLKELNESIDGRLLTALAAIISEDPDYFVSQYKRLICDHCNRNNKYCNCCGHPL